MTSQWRNDHARIYRALVRELDEHGHRVLFLEKDSKRFAKRRDLPRPPYGNTRLYKNLTHLRDTYSEQVRQADVVIVGSCLENGIEIGDWVQQTSYGVTAFYDIEPLETFRQLRARKPTYLLPEQVSRYDLYLSCVGGPVLKILENIYHSPMARALYCAADIDNFYPELQKKEWDLGYLGDYNRDQLDILDSLLVEASRHWLDGDFSIVGLQYPQDLDWPPHVRMTKRTPEDDTRAYYNSQSFSLNITDAALRKCGWAPTVRLFDAAACGVPVITDDWPGIHAIFEPGSEILVSRSHEDTLRYIRLMSPNEREAVGIRALHRIYNEHLPVHRAQTLEAHVRSVADVKARERIHQRVAVLAS